MLWDGGLMANLLYEVHLQGIMVVVFISLDWMFVLMNTTTMIPCRRVLYSEMHVQGIVVVYS